MFNFENHFPNLSGRYTRTSEATHTYNSIAWAVEWAVEDKRYWSPEPLDQYYWPSDIPREETLETFTQVFCSLGYELCSSRDPEPGYEKIAIYVDSNGKPTHVARQLRSGNWTSKILDYEDIEHNSLDGLTGEVFGSVGRILKRHIR